MLGIYRGCRSSPAGQLGRDQRGWQVAQGSACRKEGPQEMDVKSLVMWLTWGEEAVGRGEVALPYQDDVSF